MLCDIIDIDYIPLKQEWDKQDKAKQKRENKKR